MDLKKNYLALLVVLVVFAAVFAGFAIYKAPAVQSSPSGTFALMSSCKELNNMFLNNNCYGPGDFDGYTCMKIMEAKEQLNC